MSLCSCSARSSSTTLAATNRSPPRPWRACAQQWRTSRPRFSSTAEPRTASTAGTGDPMIRQARRWRTGEASHSSRSTCSESDGRRDCPASRHYQSRTPARGCSWIGGNSVSGRRTPRIGLAGHRAETRGARDNAQRDFAIWRVLALPLPANVVEVTWWLWLGCSSSNALS